MNFSIIISPRLHSLRKHLLSPLLLVFLALPGTLSAAGNCSPYLGLASLNEFFKDQTNQAYDADDFVEVKLLDPAITSAIYGTWTIRICEQNVPGSNNDSDGCSSTTSLSTFSGTNYPWIILKGNIGRYVNFKTGFDALLLDSNGDVIDYLTVDNYKPQEQAGCTGAALPFDYQASSPGASDKFIYRTPDGTGDWGSAPSASAPPTEEDTNDTAPGGTVPPVVSVANVTVNKGQTATFTFTLEKTVTYPVSVEYVTFGGNAVADTAAPVPYDYVYKTGTITFPANTTTLTQTVNITTNSVNPSTTDTVYFYLKLYNQVNAKIINSFPIGTILGNVSAELYMDETLWNNSTNQVSDSSGSANHGTPYNNVSTVTPGKLCNAGSFDGSNDYVEIPHKASLLGSTQLTYSAWINPTSWSGGIRQVMAKSVHGGGAGRAQMGIFSENSRLVGRAETSAGRYEVFTNLPTLSVWTHVALVFNGNSLTLYINGIAAPNASATYTSSKLFTATTLIQNTDPLMISKRVGSNEYYFYGLIDEVLVMQSALPGGFIKTMYDNYQLGLNWNGATRSCSGSLHHFEIDHDGTALTCNPEQVTVRACANASCSAPHYASSVNVTLSPSGWVGGNTQTLTTGLLTPQLAIRSIIPTGTQSLSITNSTVTPSSGLSATICKNTTTSATGTIGSAACNLTFHDTGFIYSIPTQTSCATSAAITVQAVRLDATTQTCVPAFANVDRNLKVWASYSNPAPAAIIGAPAVTLINGNGTYTLPSTEPAATNVSMTFAGSADETFTIAYPDAGQLILNTKYEGSAANSDSGLTMLGNNTFVVTPAKLYLYSDDTNAACASNNAACTAFKSVSTPFNLKVRAACADNSKTPNFVLNNIPVSHLNTAPAVAQGSIGVSTFNMLAGDQGEHIINNQTVSEVGVFTFTATSPTYLGVTGPTGTSTYIGRFFPHHFDNTVGQGCGSFTYSGQPFSVTTTAKNNLSPTPSVTQNYTGAFAFNTTLSNAAITPIINFNATNIIPAASFTNGTASKLDVAYTFPAKDTIPETITLRANDADTGTSIGVTEGTTEIRSGRMRLENVYGSELTALTMPLHVEYYSDNTLIGNTSDDGFILNTADSCTSYDATAGALTNYTGNLSTGETTVTGASAIAAGLGSISFSAPGAGNTGTVNLLANNVSSWLMYSWNVDCDNADADNDITTGIDAGLCGPAATASFGLYRGDDRVIYWREVF